MNYFPAPTRQDLHVTELALYALRESHRLAPADRRAIDRVLRIIIDRSIALHHQPQDLHP